MQNSRDLFIASLAVWCLCSISFAADPDMRYVERVKSAGLEPTAEALEAYLVALEPNDEVRKKVAALIKQFDSGSFRERQDASTKLGRLPVLPLETVRTAAKSGNPETRWRAQHLLNQYDEKQSRRAETLFAVFKTIDLNKVSVPLETILESIPRCSHRFVVDAALASAKASVKAPDEALLRGYLTSPVPTLRAAATETLASLHQSQGKKADEAVVEMLKDEVDEVRLAAARALANEGDPQSLSVLADLLQADSLDVRTRAIATLRPLTKQRFAYAAYDDTARRDGPVSKWRKWIDENDGSANLHFPLKQGTHHWGRLLVCMMGFNKVVEYDASRKETWKKEGLNGPYACTGTPQGGRIIATYRDRAVTEYDASGKQVWQKTGLAGAPMCVARLDNGNVLAGFSAVVKRKSAGKVIEIDRKGKTVREINLTGSPVDIQRLPNGNVLVTVYNKREIIEFDSAGKEVWKLEGLRHPRSARRLANGNTLVSIYSDRKIVEYDRDKKEVWSTTLPFYPMRAIAMDNGNIMVAHNTGVSEIDRQGKDVWSARIGNVTSIERY